jgi:hypothetical protein
MRSVALAIIRRYLRKDRAEPSDEKTLRLYLVGPTAKLIQGGVGPEADWHGRYESGR